MRKVARKSGLRRSAIAILRRYCRIKTDVKIIIQSRDLAGVSVTLWQRVTFLHLWHCFATYKGKRSCRGPRVAPLFCPSRFKKFTAFSAHKSGLEKIGANNAPKKLPPAIFACPSFANKIISALLKLSAKEWSSPVARTSVRFVRESRRQKKRAYNSLPSLF